MERTLSLLASSVATVGHLLFALAARRSGGVVPRAFARLAAALAAWSFAHFVHDLMPDVVGREFAWIAALALPPTALELAARVHGDAPRLARAARLAWIPAALLAVALLLLPTRAIPVAAAVLFPSLVVSLVALQRAHSFRGQSARLFLVAAALCVVAGFVDNLDVVQSAWHAPRLAALASLLLVAALGSSAAREGLYALEPMAGRAATLAIVALGVAVALAEATTNVSVAWGRRLLTWLVLLGFGLAVRPLLESLRSPRARELARRRKAFVARLDELDALLARATNLRELRRGLVAALACDAEVAAARLEFGGRRPSRARGRVVLPLRSVDRRRRIGVVTLDLREPLLARPRATRRALRHFATRVAVAASALRMQQQRRRTERLAQLGALAAGLAHEIKNPLGAILGALDLLDTPQLGAESRRWLDVIRQESRRLDRVVSDALALGREPKLERTLVDAYAVAEGARLLAQERARQARVELSLRAARSDDATAAAPSRDSHVELDADQVRHALLNLLLNGVSVQRDGGRVELAVEPRDGGVAFHVRDDGPGVPAELRARIFEPFFTTRPTGSGIGLAVAQRVALAHGGRLDLAAPDGGFCGAHFVLTIPSHATAAAVRG